jgi:hypothetical protein
MNTQDWSPSRANNGVCIILSVSMFTKSEQNDKNFDFTVYH